MIKKSTGTSMPFSFTVFDVINSCLVIIHVINILKFRHGSFVVGGHVLLITSFLFGKFWFYGEFLLFIFLTRFT